MATRKKGSEEKNSRVAKVVINATEDCSPYYVNVIEVTNSTHDITLSCARAPSKVTSSQMQVARETGELHVDVGIQIVFAPTLLPALIRILTDQQNKYEAEFGKIRSQD